MARYTAQPFDFESVRERIKVKTQETRADLMEKHAYIQNNILNNALDIEDLRKKSTHLLGAGAMAGAFLIAPPDWNRVLPQPEAVIHKIRTESKAMPIIAPQKVFIDTIKSVLPQKPRALTRSEEKSLEQVFSKLLEVPAKATLEGEHLNTTYGLIGAEQHLKRYPGDTVSDQVGNDFAMAKEGIAPGLGAWGYFAPSKAAMTPDLVEKEKWYAVVQTLYLPDWNERTRYLRDWYKHRKVLIVNTDNGNAVVAAIADSGPAAWTGKQFGGSPEVMMHLGGPRYKKGPVVVFFVDDPENKIPLGPVEYNKIQLPEWAFHEV